MEPEPFSINYGEPVQSVLAIDPPEQRARLSVAFRLFLVLPHLIVLGLVSVGVVVAIVVGWFAALALGRLPERIAHLGERFLAYSTKVTAYAWLLVDQYPRFRFEEPAYPVQVEVERTPLNRAAVLFRVILGLPAMILTTLSTGGLYFLGFVAWLSILITGRMPLTLGRVIIVIVRYAMRYYAYLLMLTAAYPAGLFGDRSTEEPALTVPPSDVDAEMLEGSALASEESVPRAWQRSFVLSGGAKALLVIAMILGLGLQGVNVSTTLSQQVAQQGAEQLAEDYQQLSLRFGLHSAAMENCEDLPCIQREQAGMRQAVSEFLADMRAITFPEPAADAAVAVIGTGEQLILAFRELEAASTPAAYQRLAADGDLERLATRFDAQVAGLFTSL